MNVIKKYKSYLYGLWWGNLVFVNMPFTGEKIGSGKMCLWCSDRSKVFHSVKATQQHMLDKGHSMLLHDGDAVFEYADFYDYT